MKSATNKVRLNNFLRGMQKSIDLFPGQGYGSVYFTAQFMRDGKKQNGITRGDVAAFASQIRTYVDNEEADSVRIEFFDDSSEKSIYSKVLSGLRTSDSGGGQSGNGGNGGGGFSGFSGFNGLGSLGEAEFTALVDKRVEVREQTRDYARVKDELQQANSRIETLQVEKADLEETLKAKKDTEYYMGIIGTVFPGLATLFQGSRLANAASFLAGTTDIQGNALPQPQEGGESSSSESETASIAAMVSEFCHTLSVQEAGIVHLLFMAFEKDRSQMQRALQFISQTPAKA